MLVLINPQIVGGDGLEKQEEGCLSLPDFRQTVERAMSIKVTR